MSKIGIAGLVLSLVAVAPATECNVGGKPGNVDDPEQGTAQCTVVDRQINSNGTAYLKIDCNGGGIEDAEVRSLMTHDELPYCKPYAAWPGCKDQ